MSFKDLTDAWNNNSANPWGRRDERPEPLPDLTPPLPPRSPKPEPIDAPLPPKKFSNCKNLIARFSNKRKAIADELKAQREFLLKDLPRLLGWEERADAFIAILNALGQAGGVAVRTPEIKKEKDQLQALLKKSESSLKVLEGYLKKDITLWVKPLNCLPAETSTFRVSLAIDIKEMMSGHADRCLADLLKLRPLSEQLKTLYQALESKQAAIDSTYAELEDVMSDFRDFKRQVEDTTPENLSTHKHVQHFSDVLATALLSWEKAEGELVRMRHQIALLSDWLYNPELVPISNTTKNINCISLGQWLTAYTNKQFDSTHVDVTKIIKDFTESFNPKKQQSKPQEITIIDTLRELEQLEATPEVPVSVITWIKEASESAIKRLTVKKIEVEQTSLRYLSVKKRAKEKFEMLKSLQATATNELPVLPKQLARTTLFPNLPSQTAQASRGSYLYYILSLPLLPLTYFYSSQKVGKHPINPEDSDTREVWITSATVGAEKLLGKFKKDTARLQLLCPDNQRTLESQPPPTDKSGLDHCRAYAFASIRDHLDVWINRLNPLAATATDYDVRHRLLLAVAPSVEKLDVNNSQRHYWNAQYSTLQTSCNILNAHFQRWKTENPNLQSILANLEVCVKTMQGFQNSLTLDDHSLKKAWTIQEYAKEMIGFIQERLATIEKACEIPKILAKKEKAFGPVKPAVNPAILLQPVDWLPPRPINLRTRLNISVGPQGNPAELLKVIDDQLGSLERKVSTHEVEKLKYHDDKFSIQSNYVNRFLQQMTVLISNIEFLNKFATTIVSLYEKEPYPIPKDKEDTRNTLQDLVNALLNCHQLIAQDVKAFKPMISRAKELLDLLAERQSKKLTDEKIKWRAEQVEIGLRKQPSIDKRLQQLKQAEAFFRASSVQIDELWRMANASYQFIPPKIHDLNLKLHGQRPSYFSRITAETLTIDPFTALEAEPIPEPAPASLLPPGSSSQPAIMEPIADDDPNHLSALTDIADRLIPRS